MKLVKEIDQTENEWFWEIFEFGGFELGLFFFFQKREQMKNNSSVLTSVLASSFVLYRLTVERGQR